MLELPYEVTESDVEKTYRHVHHAASIKLLEWARLELLKKIGFPSEALIERDLYPVVTSVRVYYRREILMGPITVTCDSCTHFDRCFTMKQRILNHKGKVAIEAEVDWLMMGGKSRRTEAPPADFMAALKELAPQLES